MPGAVRYVQFAVHKILTYVSCCNGELQDHCCVDVLVSRTSLLLSIVYASSASLVRAGVLCV